MNENPYSAPDPGRVRVRPEWREGSERSAIFRRKSGPWTTGFLLASFFVWLGSAFWFDPGSESERAFFRTFGFIPEQFWSGGRLWSPLSFLFVHAHSLHYITNALIVMVFGPEVEVELVRRHRTLYAVFFAGVGILTALIVSVDSYGIEAAFSNPHVGMMPLAYALLAFYTVYWPNRFIFFPFVRMWVVGGILLVLGLGHIHSFTGVLAGLFAGGLFRVFRVRAETVQGGG